jgi:hypothetical protein
MGPLHRLWCTLSPWRYPVLLHISRGKNFSSTHTTNARTKFANPPFLFIRLAAKRSRKSKCYSAKTAHTPGRQRKEATTLARTQKTWLRPRLSRRHRRGSKCLLRKRRERRQGQKLFKRVICVHIHHLHTYTLPRLREINEYFLKKKKPECMSCTYEM